MKNNWIYFIFCFFVVSCATPRPPEEQLSLEEEEAFLLEEEEDFDFEAELEKPDTEELYLGESEEDAAESEIENIEDEFADFIEEDEQIQEDAVEPPVQEEIAQTPLEFEEPLGEEDLIEPSIEGDGSQESLTQEEIAQTPLEFEEPLAQEDSSQSLPEIEESFEEENLTEPSIEEVGEILQEDPIEEEIVSLSEIRVTNIRYEQGQIFIDTVGGEISYRTRFNEATKQLIIEITDSVIVDNLKWPYIMKEFQSDFALLQADQKTDQVVRIIIQMHPESTAPTVVQKEDATGIVVASSSNLTDLTVGETSLNDVDLDEIEQNFESLDESFSADQESEVSSEEGQILGARSIYDFLLKDHKFYGNRVTIDVREARLKDLLYFLSEDAGLNMIISERIPDDTISLRLKEVPWDQALILIMERKELAYVRKGGVITIGTVQEFQQEQTRIERFKLQQESLAPLKVEVIPLAYAQVGDVTSLINGFKTQKGNITSDSENNSLIVYDTSESIEKMRSLIRVLDRVPKQVMISAKIVEVVENFARNFGVNWGFSNASSFSIGPGGGLQMALNPALSFLGGSNPNSATLGSNVNIGRFDFVGDLDARFGISENEGTARVLSSPRVITLNGESASINQSSESLTFTQSLSGPDGEAVATNVERTPLSLNLNVTPTVTNVNSIYMQIQMSRQFAGAREGQGESSAAPTNSRSANTNILLKSGQTAVIGGIYETQERESLLGFPLLKYIPFVKWLFSQTNTDNLKTELLLFITPRVISIDENLDEASTQISSRTP